MIVKVVSALLIAAGLYLAWSPWGLVIAGLLLLAM